MSDEVQRTTPPRLAAQALCVVRHGRRILDDVTVDIAEGELIGVVGPNGAGKSTLIDALAGLIVPDAGEVSLDGVALDTLEPSSRARRIGWLEQSHRVEWPLDVQTVVALGRLPHLAGGERIGAADRLAIDAALTRTDTERFRHRRVPSLSGGERARVLLARVLAGEPDAILADEPTAALDPRYQLDTMSTLRHYVEAGGAAMVAMHDLSLAARFCDRLYLLAAGRVVAAGLPTVVLVPERLAAVYGVDFWCTNSPVPIVVPIGTHYSDASR